MKTPSKPQLNHLAVNPRDLMKLPGKEALEVILDSPRPVSLVQSLAHEDLYWLIKDIGVQDALPILSLASNDQWQYLLDLELWSREHLEAAAVGNWLTLLMKADPERFFVWTLREQLDLVELHLLRQIEVRILEHDEPPSDLADDYFTEEGVFYIRVKEQKYEEATREFLQRLSNHDHVKYREIMLELADMVPAEAEEEIYRLRNVRLAEKGFLPFEEAVAIYRHRDPASLRGKEPETARFLFNPAADEAVPVTTSSLIPGEDLFAAALEHVDNVDFLQKLQREFAAMCNQIVCADGLRIPDKEALAPVVAKACGYLSIGIDSVVGKDVGEARVLVQRVPLQEIFRVGFGTALALRWKTEKWLEQSWFAVRGFDFNFWGDEWAGIIRGLLKKRPLFYTGFSGGEPYRDFKSLGEVMRCQGILDRMAAVDRCLALIFGETTLHRLESACHPVTYQNLLLTAWARHELGLDKKFQPLSEKELQNFFERLGQDRDNAFQTRTDWKEAFRHWLEKQSGLDASELRRGMDVTIEKLFCLLDEECGRVSPQHLDVRYVRLFLVAP